MIRTTRLTKRVRVTRVGAMRTTMKTSLREEGDNGPSPAARAHNIQLLRPKDNNNGGKDNGDRDYKGNNGNNSGNNYAYQRQEGYQQQQHQQSDDDNNDNGGGWALSIP